MVKLVQRLDCERLADALVQRGLVEAGTIRQVQEECAASRRLFTEALVTDGLVSDWELSKVACEVFGLAFFGVDAYQPAKEALSGIDPRFLREHCLVPLDRFGGILTVAMPSIAPSDVLATLGRHVNAEIVPVIGTVATNRRWLDEHLPVGGVSRGGGLVGEGGSIDLDGEWIGMFDQADEQVRKDAEAPGGPPPRPVRVGGSKPSPMPSGPAVKTSKPDGASDSAKADGKSNATKADGKSSAAKPDAKSNSTRPDAKSGGGGLEMVES